MVSHILLELKDKRSYGVHDLLDAHGWRTTINRHGCSGRKNINSRDTLYHLNKAVGLLCQFGTDMCSIALREDSGFNGLVWHRSVETYTEEELGHILKAEPLA